MIELKVHCDCGQKYKFDVEPVNDQMPFTVTCPICGRDGTERANAQLQQMKVFKMVEPAPEQSSAPPPAPAPIAATSLPTPGKLRLSSSAAPPAPPPIAPAAGNISATPPPIGSIPRRPVAIPVEASGKQPSFALGLLGSLIGALVGAGIYFTIYKITGSFFMLRYILAVAVGALTGWLANLLGKGEGSKSLAGLAALLTVTGILTAQYVLTLERFHADADLNKVNQSIADGGYAESVKEAKEVAKVIPTGSDAEIRMYLAKQLAGEGQPPKLEDINNEEIKQFRDNELTNYLYLASGKTTKEAYWAQNGFDPKKAKKILDTEATAMSGVAVILAVFKAGIFSMLAGAAVAFKLSYNANAE